VLDVGNCHTFDHQKVLQKLGQYCQRNLILNWIITQHVSMFAWWHLSNCGLCYGFITKNTIYRAVYHQGIYYGLKSNILNIQHKPRNPSFNKHSRWRITLTESIPPRDEQGADEKERAKEVVVNTVYVTPLVRSFVIADRLIVNYINWNLFRSPR